MTSSTDSVQINLNITTRGWKELKSITKEQHGMFTLEKLISLEKYELKSLKTINDIIFLKRCKSLHLIPKGLRLKNHWTDIPKSQSLFDNLERKLLGLIINNNFKMLAHLKTKIDNNRNFLEKEAPALFPTMTSYIQDSICRDKVHIKATHQKKLSNLINSSSLKDPRPNHLLKTSNPTNNCINKDSIINLSNRLLSQSAEEVLSLGLNFSIPKKKHKELIIEAGINIEQGLNEIDIDEQDKDHIRLGVSKILKSEINNPDPSTPLSHG
jgi:hypothetical protein